MQPESSKIVQNSEESYVFLYEKKNEKSVSPKKRRPLKVLFWVKIIDFLASINYKVLLLC